MARLYRKRFRSGPNLYRKRLKKLQELFCKSISPNVTDLTLSLSWAYGFLLSKRFVGQIPRKFVLHGLLVECKDKTLDGLPEAKKEMSQGLSSAEEGKAKVKKKKSRDPSRDKELNAEELAFLDVIRVHKIKSSLRKSCPSFNGKKADTRFWKKRWDKHGCKTGLELIDYFKMSLYLRRLFTTGLHLKKNRPMKAETLIRCIKRHLRVNLNLDATPRIKCRLVPKLMIPRPTRKVHRMIFRRRLFVLEEIKLSVDPSNLKFVDTPNNPYQGSFKAKSLVIIPYLKSRPV